MKSETKYPLHMYPRFQRRPAGLIDGVFLVDSIAFFRSEYGRTNYMSEALQYILWSTGLYCMAIVVPGAWYSTFSMMASSIPAEYGNTFFVVVLSCGNDVYSLARQRGRRGIQYIQEIIEQDAVGIADGVGAFLQDLRARTTGGILLVYVSFFWTLKQTVGDPGRLPRRCQLARVSVHWDTPDSNINVIEVWNKALLIIVNTFELRNLIFSKHLAAQRCLKETTLPDYFQHHLMQPLCGGFACMRTRHDARRNTMTGRPINSKQVRTVITELVTSINPSTFHIKVRGVPLDLSEDHTDV